MNKSPHYNQQAEPEVDDMYLPKLGFWPSVSKNTGAMQQIVPVKGLCMKVLELWSNMKQ